MITDELQNLASNFRFAGIVITFIGFIVTCLSHVAAERLLTAQRADKAVAQERLKASDDELQSTKAKADQLERTLAPRTLADEQIKHIASLLHAAAQDGKATVPIVVASRMMDAESLAYGRQILGAIEGTGWQQGHTELSTHSFSGVSIFPNPPIETDPLKTVLDAFRQSGVPFSTQVLDIHKTPIQHEPAIYIIVGHK